MRALPLCLTTWAARSSVRPTVWTCSPAEKRSSTALVDGCGRDGSRGVTADAGSSGRGTSSRPLRSSVTRSPASEVAGMSPGWPSATGSGPSVMRDVSTVSTPFSIVCAKRSRPRGAGPSS